MTPNNKSEQLNSFNSYHYKLAVGLILILALLGAYYIYIEAKAWHSKTFQVTDDYELHPIYEQKLKAGQTILTKLDIEEGGLGTARVLLEGPDGLGVELVFHQQHRNINTFPAQQDGIYKLTLATKTHDYLEAGFFPEVTVSWRFK